MFKKILAILCGCAAAACGVYGILIFGTGSGTGFFLVWLALAVVFAALGISVLFDLWKKVPKPAAWVLTGLVLAGIILFGAVEVMIAGQMHAQGEPGLDYIIVLGAQVRESGPSRILKYRLDRAAEYLKENPDTICIVSGGQGYNEPFPEAEGMASYLQEQGIGQERMILESESESTEENIRNSMEFIDDRASVGIVTNDFHVFRAVQTAEKEGLKNVCGIAGGSPRLYLPNNMFREFFAEIKFLLF